MSYALFADVVSLILIFAGALLVLSAAIGVARFQDPMSRIHFVTKPQTVGLIFTILGAAIRATGPDSLGVPGRGDLAIFFLLFVFAWATAPFTARGWPRISDRRALKLADETWPRIA